MPESTFTTKGRIRVSDPALTPMEQPRYRHTSIGEVSLLIPDVAMKIANFLDAEDIAYMSLLNTTYPLWPYGSKKEWTRLARDCVNTTDNILPQIITFAELKKFTLENQDELKKLIRDVKTFVTYLRKRKGRILIKAPTSRLSYKIKINKKCRGYPIGFRNWEKVSKLDLEVDRLYFLRPFFKHCARLNNLESGRALIAAAHIKGLTNLVKILLNARPKYKRTDIERAITAAENNKDAPTIEVLHSKRVLPARSPRENIYQRITTTLSSITAIGLLSTIVYLRYLTNE